MKSFLNFVVQAMTGGLLGTSCTLAASPAPQHPWAMPIEAPRNPVEARVFVLTDYHCASACISFVDELKRFPGVEQIGVETGIDSRTGTAFAAPLPSGNGVIHVPTVTRDGRERAVCPATSAVTAGTLSMTVLERVP